MKTSIDAQPTLRLKLERSEMRKRGLIAAVVAAKMLGVHYVTVHRWIVDNKVVSEKANGWRVYITVASLVKHLGPTLAKVHGLLPKSEGENR
jgi:hypothetical protein